MITISIIKDFIIQEGYRIFKVMQYGPKTVDECSPFGDDSNPLKDMDAVFCETEVGGEPIIIGYIQKQRLAEPGEKRIYSLDEDGELSNYIWLKKDKIIEIGGSDDNLVAYKNLNQGLQDYNQKVLAELGKVSAAISALGGSYAVGQLEIDIEKSKTDELKCSKPE